MSTDDKPWKRDSCFERNEDDIITRRMINMIMGTGSGTKGRGTTHYDEATDGSVPHGTSQNLRKKASCHMHVIL